MYEERVAEKLAVDGGPKAVTNSLAGWPQFEQALKSGKTKAILPV